MQQAAVSSCDAEDDRHTHMHMLSVAHHGHSTPLVNKQLRLLRLLETYVLHLAVLTRPKRATLLAKPIFC